MEEESKFPKIDTEWNRPPAGFPVGICQYGYSDCQPGYHYGPAVREHYLFHFIVSGSGTFTAENGSYPLTAGSGFSIFPDKVTSYRADSSDPWSYFWIGLQGEAVADLLEKMEISDLQPIFRFSDRDKILKIYREIESISDRRTAAGQLRLSGLSLLLLSEILPQSTDCAPVRERRLPSTVRDTVAAARLFFRQNYMEKIGVADVAERFGMERSYFSSVFKRYSGCSPITYLLGLRLTRAHALLSEGRLPVADVARTVGYDDPLLFSRLFRKHTGASPREVQKNPKVPVRLPTLPSE